MAATKRKKAKKPSPYETLGVDTTATPDQITKAYRKKAVQHHPDHGGDKKAFAETNDAYRTLIDPARRARFDATGETEEANELPPVLQILIAAFNEILGQAISRNINLEQADLVGDVKRKLSAVSLHIDGSIDSRRKEIKKLNKVVSRLSVSDGDNILSQSLIARIRIIEESICHDQEELERVRAALTLANKYTYQHQKATTSVAGMSFDSPPVWVKWGSH